MLKRTRIVNQIKAHRAEIESHGVRSLALFGSVARDEASPDSDIDLLVEFSHPVGLFQFIALKQYLEGILEGPVDLGTLKSLKPRLKDDVIKDAIYVV
jgi:predicted nucleotidyltransferase